MITTLEQAKAAGVPVNSTTLHNYTFVTWENGTADFPTPTDVAYGANGLYVYRRIQGRVTFDNATFGDPNPGVFKVGYQRRPEAPPLAEQPKSAPIAAPVSAPAVTAAALTASVETPPMQQNDGAGRWLLIGAAVVILAGLWFASRK